MCAILFVFNKAINEIAAILHIRHSREGGNPGKSKTYGF